jgi:ADP-ribosylglycohydrolase
MPTLRERFRGCLLGLAIGDALGGRFEAQSPEHLRARFPNPVALFDYPTDEIWYTDDTQMMIGVAETLVAHRAIVESELCKAFVANYLPSRGYGRGARAVLEAMEERRDHVAVAERYHPGGSLGNGIQELDSVPTALASFALTPNSYIETVGNVILLGGDTDTLAAMAGALSGAFLGVPGIPARLIGLLESSPKGRDYLIHLADQLHDAVAAKGEANQAVQP